MLKKLSILLNKFTNWQWIGLLKFLILIKKILISFIYVSFLKVDRLVCISYIIKFTV